MMPTDIFSKPCQKCGKPTTNYKQLEDDTEERLCDDCVVGGMEFGSVGDQVGTARVAKKRKARTAKPKQAPAKPPAPRKRHRPLADQTWKAITEAQEALTRPADPLFKAQPPDIDAMVVQALALLREAAEMQRRERP